MHIAGACDEYHTIIKIRLQLQLVLDNKYVIVYNFGRRQETRPNYFLRRHYEEPPTMDYKELKQIFEKAEVAANTARKIAHAADAATKRKGTNEVWRLVKISKNYSAKVCGAVTIEGAAAIADKAVTAAAKAIMMARIIIVAAEIAKN